ncbi:MAG: DUF1700 domain-containing protein [Tissierellia bacterium]|nr:DUF1700 domain-containing protein [Tissierellia bacterium]
MNRADYISDLEARLSRLSFEERQDAISFYEEIFDERGIFEEDLVADDIPSPRKASFEILRDANLDQLEKEKGKDSFPTFKTLALYILALPVGLPLALVILILVFSALISIFAVGAKFLMGGFASISIIIYELVTFRADSIRVMYLFGVLSISIAASLFMILALNALVKLIKRKLIDYRKTRR